MKRKNFPARKDKRREEAIERQKRYKPVNYRQLLRENVPKGRPIFGMRELIKNGVYRPEEYLVGVLNDNGTVKDAETPFDVSFLQQPYVKWLIKKLKAPTPPPGKFHTTKKGKRNKK